MKFIYVAGPYTGGDPAANTDAAIAAGDKLMLAGFIPFVPHFCHFWHARHPHEYQDWIRFDLAWLTKCDALLRLQGESPGADGEVNFALAHGIRVYTGIQALIAQEGTI
jgi:hypothetical protein